MPDKDRKDYLITSQIHVDKPLTNVSIAYRNQTYIAQDVFPLVPVKKDSDKYFIFSKDGRIPETLRANRGEAREHTLKMTTNSYMLDEHALKDYISQRDMDNFDLGDLRADVVESLKDKILLRMEKSVADLFNITTATSSPWSQNVSLASTQAWSSNSAGSNPLIITDTAATTVLAGCFRKPNTFIMPYAVKQYFKKHDSILDRIKYTSKDIDNSMIASLIDVEKLLVPEVQYESTKEAASTTTFGALWDVNSWSGYVAKNPSMRNPSAGYIFTAKDGGVRRWFNEERKAECIEVSERYGAYIVSSLSGYSMIDCI